MYLPNLSKTSIKMDFNSRFYFSNNNSNKSNVSDLKSLASSLFSTKLPKFNSFSSYLLKQKVRY